MRYLLLLVALVVFSGCGFHRHCRRPRPVGYAFKKDLARRQYAQDAQQFWEPAATS